MSPNPLRNLPSVYELLENPILKSLVDRISQNAVVSTVRTVLDEVRHEVQTAASDRTLPSVTDLAERIAHRIAEGHSHVVRPVINATGILFGGELGQVPLAEDAVVDMAVIARNYARSELDSATGRRVRQDTAVRDLLCELTGAEAALVVNNHAGATLATLAALAAGREVIVSRGQLIEIDDDCCLPDLIAASGALLREVGTTNKTRPDDYTQAVGPSTAALMLVCSDDFTVVGAAETVTLEDLVGVGRQRQIPVIYNTDSAAMIDFQQFGLQPEPMIGDSIKAGADLVLLRGDNLLGGPSCGIILGRKALVEQIERHAMTRALRVDRLTLAALAATLRLYRDPEKARLGIPLLRLLTTSVENLQNRAERLAPQAAAIAAIGHAEAIADVARLGWGAGTVRELPTWCVALRPAAMTVDRLAAALRECTPSVVGRVKDDRLLFDLRSVPARQDTQLLTALEALSGQEDTTGTPDRL